jgi:hypothetical protein
MLQQHENTWKEKERTDHKKLPWIVLQAALRACRLHDLTRTKISDRASEK